MLGGGGVVITAWLLSELMLPVFFPRSAASFVPPSSPPPGCSGRPVRRSRLLTSLGSGGERAGKGGGVETRDLDAETAAAGSGDT